jgi:hypothetical protein
MRGLFQEMSDACQPDLRLPTGLTDQRLVVAVSTETGAETGAGAQAPRTKAETMTADRAIALDMTGSFLELCGFSIQIVSGVKSQSCISDGFA